MAVDFGSYEAADYWPDQWLRLTGREARAVFEQFLRAIPDRIGSFEGLLQRNGLPAGYGRLELQMLNDWFREHVTADATGAWPDLRWGSVTMDVGLYLGQALVERHENLHWDLGASAPSLYGYRHHVIVGFTKDGYIRDRVSPSAVMFTYATRVIHESEAEVVVIRDRPMTFGARPIEERRFVEFVDGVSEMA
jgi:hypothetical protein